MNFPLNNLTYKKNINLFSTPKFKDIKIDIEGTKNTGFFKNDSINNNSPIDVTINQSLNNQGNNLNELNLINKEENSYKENNNEIYLKENFSLSSLKNINSNNDKLMDSKNIIDLRINSNKKREKNNKCNIALISFCDKSDNYSLNNYSCSTYKEYKEKQDENNNIKSDTEKKYKESEVKSNSNKSNNSNSNSNSNSNGNDNTSFKYNLPLENDKIPIINDFMNFQDNNTNKNEIEENKIKEENSFEFGHSNKLDNIDSNIKKNKSIKEDLLYHYKMNNIISNNEINSPKRKVKKSQTEKYCRIDNILPIEKSKGDNINLKNKSVIEKSDKNINKLIIKKTIIHSYDNFKKVKKKIKTSAIKEIKSKVNEKNKEEEIIPEKVNKIISPRKKFELIIKQIDINADNNENYKEDLHDDNNNPLYSYTTRESKIVYNFPPGHESSLNSYRKVENNIYNRNNFNNNYNNSNNRASNTTNKIKNKNRKFIKTSAIDYNKTFFNFNKLKKIEESGSKTISRNSQSKELNSINKKLYSMYKKDVSKNYIKKDFKITNNKKYSYHTRNISNLYSNKMFNGVKNLFNNGIFNTINYETNDVTKKKENNNMLQTQIKIKPHIKTIIKKAAFLQKANEIKNSINKFSKKEIPSLYLKNNNIKFSFPINSKNNANDKYKTINQEKNNKNKNQFNLFKKIKKENITKSKMPSFNKFKNYLLKNKNSNKVIQYENKNQTKYKLPTSSTVISGSNTDRIIRKNNNNKSLINDSIFINVNDSSNSLQNDSRNNKIKVNTLRKKKRSPNISGMPSKININSKTNSYWKIHKKPKNSCLLNNCNNDTNKKEDNYNGKYHITLGDSYEKYIKGNTQILIFNKNQPNKMQDLNNLRERINQFNLTDNNSKSVISESSYTDRKNYSNSINDDLNIKKTKFKFTNKKVDDINVNININKIYHNENRNFIKSFNNANNVKYQSNESSAMKMSDFNNYKSKIQNYKEEILKYSILRNNQNNQIINEFSVVLGEEKDKKIEQNNDDVTNSKIKESNKSLENKRTIINVNQFYPSYYIGSHDIMNDKNKLYK